MTSPSRSRLWIAIPSPLRAFLLLLALLTLVCGLAEFIAQRYLHYPVSDHHAYPLLWEYHPDFVYFAVKFQHLHTIQFFTTDPLHPFMYPAPLVLVYALFYRIGGVYALPLFLASILLSFTGATTLVALALRRHGLSTVTAATFAGSVLFLAYPLWFLFNQANMEFVVWLVLSIGFLAFFHRKPYPAAICFAIAGSMKLLPFVYLGLLLARRQYRAIALSLAVATSFTGCALWIVHPNVATAWRLIQAGVLNFSEMYMLHLRPERGFDHSLFGLAKLLTPVLPAPEVLSRALTAYLLLVASIGVALYLLRIRKLPVINQVLCLTCVAVLLPPTSFDYTLIHLYTPWLLLVFYTLDRYRRPREIPASPALLPTLLCFAILFAPLTEFIYHDELLGGCLRALVLGLLFFLALTSPFDDKALEQACAASNPLRNAA